MTIPHSTGIDFNNNIEKQVSSAYLNTNMNLTSTDVIGNTNKYTLIHETSSILNLATGKFVIPKSGLYQMSIQILHQIDSGITGYLSIRNNNNAIAFSEVKNYSTIAEKFSNHTSSVDYFNLGDQISFHFDSPGGTNTVFGIPSIKLTWVSLVEL